MASSRVGSRISACAAGAACGRFCSISTIGIRKPSVLPVPVCAVASTSRPSRAGGMQPACTGVGVSNLLALSRAMRAGERENCENCVVKIKYFPVGSGSRSSFPWGLQSEPDLEARTRICQQAQACLSNMRKGEPKVVPRTDQRHSRGECPGPELPHATCTPGGTLPTGTTLLLAPG